MAESQEGIFFSIRLDTSDLEKSTASAKDRLNQLIAEQARLNVSTEEGRKAFNTNAKELRALEQQVKSNEKALSGLSDAEKDNTDQVNFSNNSIKQNRELLKQLNAEYIKIQKPTAEQTARLKNLTDTLKSQESAIGNNTRNVGNYKEAFASALQGVQGFGGGLGNLFKLILTNPIGILVTAVLALFSAFKKLEPVAEFLERTFAALGAAFDSVVGAFSKLVQGDFSGFFDGVTTGAANAANETFRLTRAIQDLEERQIANIEINAQAEAQVKKLLIQAKDRTKSEADRLVLLDKASKIEEGIFKRKFADAARNEANLKKEIEITSRAGTVTDEQRRKAAEAAEQRIQLESESAVLQEKIINRRNLLLQEINEQQQKASEDEQKRQDQETKNLEKNIQEQKKIREEQLKTQQLIKNFQKAIRDQEIKEQTDQTLKEQDDRDQKQKQREKDFLLFLENQQLEAKTFEEFQSARIAILENANKQAVENTALSEEEQKNIILKNNEAIRQIENETIAARIAAQQALGQSFSDLSKLAGEQTEAGKALAIIATTISTFAAAQKAYEATIGIPFVGPALAPINAAIAIAQGLFRLKKINEIRVPAFAEGGLTGQRIGNGDGIPIQTKTGDNLLAMVKTDEVILNKRQQRLVGGDEIFRKIGVRGFADGGLTGQTIVNNTNATIQTTEIAQAISRMQIAVSVQEITDVQNRLKLFETLSRL